MHIHQLRSNALNQKQQREQNDERIEPKITLHLQEFSAVNVKGATLKG